MELEFYFIFEFLIAILFYRVDKIWYIITNCPVLDSSFGALIVAAKSSEPFTRVKKMIRSMSVFALVSGLGFISIATPLHAEGIQDVLSGKTLTSAKGKTVYVLGQDGVLGGKIAKHKVVGIWEVRDGQWCRTISEPKDREGDACREVAIDGENVTLTGDGQSIMYTMK